MKDTYFYFLLAAAGFLFFITFAMSQAPSPQLSVAERVALQAIEKEKSDAQQMIERDMQAETNIEGDFATRNPGYRINPRTFLVEKIEKIEKKP